MSDSLSQSDPQTITFNEIPSTLRDPGTRVEIRPNYGDVGLLLLPSKAIVISQMLSGGLATPGVVYPITAPGQAEQLFVAGSAAAAQINAWLANNTSTPLFAMGLSDPSGAVKASQTILIGTASFAGGFSVTVKIGGFRLPIVIPAGTTQADLQTAIITAVNAMPALLVTAAAVGSTSNVLLTAKNGGLVGNSINVRFSGRSDASMPQVALAVGSTGVPIANLTGGLGSPDITPGLATIAATWYTDIVSPWTDSNNRAVITAEMIRRYGAMVNLDARYWGGLNGSYSTVCSYGDAGNSQHMITVGVRNSVDPDWVWAAAFAAVHAFRLANDPSRQSKGIAVVGITAPEHIDQWTSQERDLLLHNGISTWTALPDHTVVISRTITGYLTSNAGVADAAWLDVMTPSTVSAIRYDFESYVDLVYPQAKLFDDDSIGAEYDNTAATPKRMRGSWAKRCLDYERAGWIEGSASTIQQGSFQRNASDKNRLDMDVVVRTAGNMIVCAAVLEFAA